MDLKIGVNNMVEKICPKCGTIIHDRGFCFECETKLGGESNGFFNRLDSKISLSTLVFSFISVLLIPCTAYLGIYMGYLIKTNL